MKGKRHKALLDKAFETLKRKMGASRAPAWKDVIEGLLFFHLADGEPEAAARKCIKKLKTAYIDWNEARVTATYELANLLARAGIVHSVEKAQQLKALLDDVFANERRLKEEALAENGVEKNRRLFGSMQSVPPQVASLVTSVVVGQPCGILSLDMIRVFKRMGLLDAADPFSKCQETMDTLVAARTAYPIYRNFHRHALEVCKVDEYDCSRCVLQSQCKTGKKASLKAQEPEPAEPRVTAGKKPGKAKAKKPAPAKAKKLAKARVKSPSTRKKK